MEKRKKLKAGKNGSTGEDKKKFAWLVRWRARDRVGAAKHGRRVYFTEETQAGSSSCASSKTSNHSQLPLCPYLKRPTVGDGMIFGDGGAGKMSRVEEGREGGGPLH